MLLEKQENVESKLKVLDDWNRTILWFKLGINDHNPLEFNVFSPPDCSPEEYAKLMEKYGSQIVGLIQKFTDDELIIQGQYRLVSKDEKEG